MPSIESGTRGSDRATVEAGLEARPTIAAQAMTASDTGRVEAEMSRRNGDRARFQKDRKRKLRHRQRIQALSKTLHAKPKP